MQRGHVPCKLKSLWGSGPQPDRDHYHDTLPPQLPSYFALYRLLCLFPFLEMRTFDFYKCLWEFELVHKETGFPFCIGEHKAALYCNVRLMYAAPFLA